MGEDLYWIRDKDFRREPIQRTEEGVKRFLGLEPFFFDLNSQRPEKQRGVT